MFSFLFFWLVLSSQILLLIFLLLFVSLQFDGFQKAAVQMVKPAKGTTTLAFIFKDGVMVAADSRASMGGYICKSMLILNVVLGFFIFNTSYIFKGYSHILLTRFSWWAHVN